MWFSKLKKSTPIKSPKEIIRHIIDYMPDFYKDQRQFIFCADYFKHKEWELALDSLIELADETGHYFSVDFWNSISIAAYQMDMKNAVKQCEQQILRNTKEIGWKISLGNTVAKIDETHFKHYIAQKIKDQWTKDRHIKDRVDEMIGKNGIHDKPSGRAGFIYWVDGYNVFEVDYELGVKGLLLYFETSARWILPEVKNVTLEDELKIKDAINKWALKQNIDIEY